MEEKCIPPKNLSHFCIKNEDTNEKCKNFHKSHPSGMSTCPYGFSCYSKDSFFYYGFIVEGYYNYKKIKGHENNSKKVKMTTYTIDDFLTLTSMKFENEAQNNKLEIYSSTLHDIKRATSAIADIFHQQYDEIDIENDNKVIYDGFDFIKTRLDYHDRILINNIATQSKTKIRTHKVLKKLSKTLSFKAQTRNVKIIFSGDPQVEILTDSKAIYILFFILIENAIKFSPNNKSVEIYMNDLNHESTVVLIKNETSMEIKSELTDILSYGYRGENSKETSGSGIGLNVAKKIMDSNNIKYEVALNNIENTIWFEFKLTLSNNLH